MALIHLISDIITPAIMTVTPYVAQGPDPSTIISALNAAYGDPQTETRNQATEQLQQWSTEPGYHATLQEISGLSELPVETRLLAMTQLRIGVEKHWRRGAAKYGAVEDAPTPSAKAVQYNPPG